MRSRHRLHPFTPSDPDFYITDAIADHAIGFLDECGAGEDPFFLYLPHCAPHFPLQAWPEDIQKYRDRYAAGWSESVNSDTPDYSTLGLSIHDGVYPRPTSARTLPTQILVNTPSEAMAVYAAMVDRLDQSIGRVLNKIRDMGKEENTLVLFLSDNGGCAEEIHNTPHLPPGTIDSYQTIGAAWAKRQQHALPAVQGLRPRRRHRHTPDRKLAGQNER